MTLNLTNNYAKENLTGISMVFLDTKGEGNRYSVFLCFAESLVNSSTRKGPCLQSLAKAGSWEKLYSRVL